MIRLTDFISRDELNDFCKKNHVKRLLLFGSALHGKMTADSDIDLLVEFEDGHIPGLLDIAGMEIEMSNIAGKKVDLRTPGELSRYFRDVVIKEAKVEYAA